VVAGRVVRLGGVEDLLLGVLGVENDDPELDRGSSFQRADARATLPRLDQQDKNF
jgi:hypothetical protein